jgi:hypothetical protein
VRIYSWQNVLTRPLMLSGVREKVRIRMFPFAVDVINWTHDTSKEGEGQNSVSKRTWDRVHEKEVRHVHIQVKDTATDRAERSQSKNVICGDLSAMCMNITSIYNPVTSARERYSNRTAA